jgi:flavin-dependent dehydrogenase
MDTDVIIIGGGPGGSTCGNLLAGAGHRVTILEKDTFPRFHIGESLLPCDLPIFERLGISLDGGPYMRKAGAEFFDERTGDHEVFLFKDGLPGAPQHAYQVERARFDHDLLLRAASAGAAVREGEKVVDVAVHEHAIEVTTERTKLRARYLIDASGQDAFLARRERAIKPLKDFGVAAVFCHYGDLGADVAGELARTGNIRVLMIEDGWVWLIPLHGGRLSCGVVTRRTGVTTDLLETTVAGSPHVQRLVQGATRTAPRVIRNFSYRSGKSRGPRWTCVGDSSIFLDPVFSSGVSLAMLAGERTADLLGPALTEGREGDPALTEPVAAEMHTAYATFASLIGAFYRTGLVKNIFFAPRPEPDLRAGLISILAGDVWRHDNRFRSLLVDSQRRWFDPTVDGAVKAADGSPS